MKYKIKYLILVLIALYQVNVQANVATSCEGTVSNAIENNISSDTQNIVSIKCTKENATASFKPGKLSIIIGQGFDFNISLNYTSKCSGSFDVENWQKKYNNIKNSLASAKDEDKEWYNNQKIELEKLLDDYINTVKAYKNKQIDTNNLPNATLSLKYKFQKVNKTKNYNFIVDSTKNNITFKEVGSSHKLLGKSVVNYEVELTSNMELIPARVYINTLGEVLDNKSSNTIDGGNKFYTDFKSDVGNYDMTITISNIGNNHNMELKNDKCRLELKAVDFSYRIINTENPFVNQKRLETTVNNWKNGVYNFVEITKKINNTKGNLYTFLLSKSDIDVIKNNSSLSNNSYLGICNTEKNQTGIIGEICDTINKS